ncbi:MAG: LacI family DNA-binding transcriptional regulator [Lachnospiraceae bacterium]
MKVSIKQISERTGFSPATVSNALNHKKGVNKDTSALIFKTAKEMGYLEENRITKIKFVIFKRNGLIIDDTPFFQLMIDGVEKECRNCGYELMVSTLHRMAADYEAQVRWLLEDRDAAVILLGTELMEDDLKPFYGVKCPLLLLDNWSEDMAFNGVLINNSDSARRATEYLIGKGHQEIGYLRGEFRIKAFRSRAVGYQIALTKAKLEFNRDFTITLGTTVDSAYRHMKQYLERKPKLPTAFFSDNDVIALGVMKALQETGVRVPQDISIIGFDDLPFSSISSPALTTLRVSKREMGQVAVRRIRDMIEMGEDSKLKIQVCTEFIVRDSVAERPVEK